MSFTSSQTSDGPTVSLLVWWNQPSEPFWTRRKSIGSMIEILDIKGSKMDCRGAYLLSLSKTETNTQKQRLTDTLTKKKHKY